MLIEALREVGRAHEPGKPVAVEVDGEAVGYDQIAWGLAERLMGLFAADKSHHRAIHGRHARQWGDPHWRDLILFHEFFDGDSGAGLGASHQTGWTALVASVMDEWIR